MAVTIEDPDAKDEFRLVTLHTPRGTRVRLISARKASRGETEHYYA